MCNMLVFVLLAICSCQNVLAQMGMGMGPLNVNLVSAKTCDGDKGYVQIDVVSIDDTQKGLTVDVNFDFPFDDKISYVARVDKVQNGQIQEGVFTHSGDNACEDFAKFLGTIWKKLVSAVGMADGCPKEGGHYHADNFPFDDKDIDIKTFLYGRFLMNVEVMKEGEKIACLVIEFTNSRPGESV